MLCLGYLPQIGGGVFLIIVIVLFALSFVIVIAPLFIWSNTTAIKHSNERMLQELRALNKQLADIKGNRTLKNTRRSNDLSDSKNNH